MAIGKACLACWWTLGLLPVSVLGSQLQPITLVNASFEDPVPGNGWVANAASGRMSEGGSDGILKPAPRHFPAGAPDGEHVAINDGRDLSQVLTEVLEANTSYRLEARVGRRMDLDFPGYSVQLWAGGSLLATESSLNPEPGSFDLSTVLYTTGASPAQLGQNLEIHLVSNGPQVSFDQVRLSKVQLMPQVQVVSPRSDPRVRTVSSRPNPGWVATIPLPRRRTSGCQRRGAVVVSWPPVMVPETPVGWPQ